MMEVLARDLEFEVEVIVEAMVALAMEKKAAVV